MVLIFNIEDIRSKTLDNVESQVNQSCNKTKEYSRRLLGGPER